MASSCEIPGLKHKVLKYGPNYLQRVGVWQPNGSDDHERSGYWVVFIHTGAWRDCRNDMYDFVPSIKQMLASPDSRIKGFASIDYRLSPHPEFPQDLATTPADELRIASHPDHLHDVCTALRLLDAEYQIAGRHVLVGHSAGAVLAYQPFMSSASVPLPSAVIGIAGVYDLVGYCARNVKFSSLFEGAFGTDRSKWDAASPASPRASYASTLAKGCLAIVAASPEDSLVDLPEVDVMEARLTKDGVRVMVVRDMKGDHDDLWQDGSQAAALVFKALAQLE